MPLSHLRAMHFARDCRTLHGEMLLGTDGQRDRCDGDFHAVGPCFWSRSRFPVSTLPCRLCDGSVFAEFSNIAAAAMGESDGADGDQDVARVLLAPATVRMTWLGDTETLSVTAENAFGEPIEGLEFGSSDSSIAQVDAMGRLSGRGIGLATITAYVLGCGESASMVVIGTF